MSKYYITTPIYYINAQAHIGHAYTTIAADVLARYHRQAGEDVVFSVGTDENSQKTVKAAEEAGQQVGVYADAMAQNWKAVWDRLDISYNRFIRTTEADHQRSVYALFEKLKESEDIYKDTYSGLYCEGCEGFVRESDLQDGLCPDHLKPPRTIEEENYFFALSRYQEQLLKHIQENPEFIQPQSRRNEVTAFINRGLEDFSISREGGTWGIPYPDDPTHTIYVWVEALINYLTVAGYPDEGFEKYWPADVHLVGKDIIKFHCVYWPALLLSAGLPLPKTVMANGFLNVGGTKISKSLGNAIDPIQLADTYGADALRYVLLRSAPFGQDGDFTLERFEAIYNSDLANDLGNLVSRVSAMIIKYQNGMIGGDNADAAHDVSRYHEAIANFQFDRALEEVSVFTKDLNLFIEQEKPWQVAKEDPEHLQEILGYLAANITHLAELLRPFMPTTSATIIDMFASGQVVPMQGTLFPKRQE